MVKDAFRFVIPIVAAAVICAVFRYHAIALALLLLAGFICYFFRNPDRSIPAGDGLVVSPADGKVVKIAALPEGEGDGGILISIFLNIFNVHVNRSPIEGKLQNLEYKRGMFKVAFDEEASRVNEQNILTIQGEGMRVVVKQIAGLIARRVICWKQIGSTIQRGELIGLIRFGSRVDVLLPGDSVSRFE